MATDENRKPDIHYVQSLVSRHRTGSVCKEYGLLQKTWKIGLTPFASPEGLFTNEPEQLAGRLRGEVVYTSVDEIIREGLHEYLDRLQQRLMEIHSSLYRTFFELPQIDLAEEIQHQQAQMQQ